MFVRDILNLLEILAPPSLQESYDNAGLITGHPDMPLHGVLFCLDSTEAVVDEAVALGCNLIVAHHPIVFKGLRRFNGHNYVERTVISAIKNDIALYAIHTNLDNVHFRGVNAKIAEKIGLQNTSILTPKAGFSDIGAGLLGTLSEPMPEPDFLNLLKNALGARCVRHTALRNKPVQKVAVCGGSGSFLLSDAQRAGADAFVTADFKYHEFFDAENRLVIADVGHYESEQYTIELLFDVVREKFPNFALHCTKVNTNPVHYWV
ncbi:MAG: Nif3-like dinuclear metal center hexameric protein [Saprospiraceae bacterium]|nr:Nif3-like dinuclear metal center hexameric protein [Saprospiraceae bacterium]